MAKYNKKLKYRLGNDTHEITLYDSTSDVGEDRLAVRDGSNTVYAALTDPEHSAASDLCIQKDVGKKAVLREASWSPVGAGLTGRVRVLISYNNVLYAGGSFVRSSYGEEPFNMQYMRFAGWNGSYWGRDVPIKGGMNDLGVGWGTSEVNALAPYAGTLYAGGKFTIGVNSWERFMTKYSWNSDRWWHVGELDGARYFGIDGPVSALAVYNGEIYLGGDFTSAGGHTASCLASYNGTRYRGFNANNEIYSLIAYNNELYAGGRFTSIGGVSANYIAKFNGTSWSAVGTGMNGAVHTLTIHNGQLYAGGDFTSAGGVSANRVAKWDGTWSALSHGAALQVNTMISHNNELYIGGRFTSAGGVPADYIAKWNGSKWSAVGAGMNGEVWALAVHGGQLYAGGDFTVAGGIKANRVAKLII